MHRAAFGFVVLFLVELEILERKDDYILDDFSYSLMFLPSAAPQCPHTPTLDQLP